MSQPYLEVTYRNGKPLAAYLYLDRLPGDKVAQSEPVDDLMVIDRSAVGRPIGIEILAPGAITLAHINSVLRSLQQPEMQSAEFRPLEVA